MRHVFPFHLVPKFIQKPLVLREYRITKSMIDVIKHDTLPRYEGILSSYDADSLNLRSKDFYQSWVTYYNQVLIEKEARFEELCSQMRSLGMRLE